MINKNRKFIFAIYLVIISSFETFNNKLEFLFVSFVLNICKNYLFKKNII